MLSFSRKSSILLPILADNIDTDTIIPSREMKTTSKTGLKDGLFAPWRYLNETDRTINPSFSFYNKDYSGAVFLAAGKNFGCGSSREHAVWALLEYGFKAIIAESFAPIFLNNSIRNGLLPIELPRDSIVNLAGRLITIDLKTQKISSDGIVLDFEIDASAKHLIINGLDNIDLTMSKLSQIDEFFKNDIITRPWAQIGQAK